MSLNIKQLIEDGSGDRQYFAMLPAMFWPDIKIVSSESQEVIQAAHAEELGVELDVYDKWLYATIKRVCGEKGGQCFLSTSGLARLAGMSEGKVSSGKKKLQEAGLITIVSKKRSAKGQAIDHITVLDVWERNIRLIKARQSLHVVKASPHEGKPSPGEHKPSPHETEEESKEEEPIEEEREDSNSNLPSLDPSISDEIVWEEPEGSALLEITIEKLSKTFGDVRHLKSNITRAYNLWDDTSLGEHEFVAKLEEAAATTKTAISKSMVKQRTKRMAYFFSVLESLLAT